MEYIGMDVHKRETQVCIIDAEGAVVLERRIRTERSRLGDVLGARSRRRILIEASTESEWVAMALETLGHDVIVADPNYIPMYATRTRRVKTDRRDARALAEANRLGAFRPAHRLAAGRRELRATLAVREALVRTRTRYLSLVRSLLRRDGISLAAESAATFAHRLDAIDLPVALAPHQALRPGRHLRPRERRGDVIALAGVSGRDLLLVREARRAQRERHRGPSFAVSEPNDDAERNRRASHPPPLTAYEIL